MSSWKADFELPDPRVMEILRQKTPQERLALAFDIWESARIIVLGAVRQQHPEFTDEQVLRETANRLSHGATERARREIEAARVDAEGG